jgi:hypothetical protein
MNERNPTTGGKASFALPTSVLHREVNKEMVLLNVESEQYFGLNEVGADIVKRLTDEPFETAMVALARDYDVHPDVLRRDVANLVDALVRAGLLERMDGSG